MKPTELRIGSLLLIGDSKTLVKVQTIGYNNVTLSILNSSSGFKHSVKIKDLEPIAITEQWLLKLGFKYDEQDEYYGKGAI